MRFVLDSSGDLTHALNYDPYGVPYQSNSATTLGFTGEQTDPNDLVYLRARYYNPRLGTFTSVDPVEGIMSRSASRNGYSYVEGNPTNLVDPSGKIWWWLVAAGIGAFLGGFTYGAGSHLGRGGNFGDALGQGLLWGTGSAGVVGALGVLAPQTMSGALFGAAGMLKGAIAPAAAWLAKSPVLKWGMIGAEAEWGRQTLEHLFPYDVNTSQFTNNVSWEALHPAQYDWWKIAKAGVLTAGGRLVLQWNGISGIPSPLMITKSPASAALYGGILSAGAGIKAKVDDNIGRGRSGLEILGDMSFADISGNFLWGSLVSGLTTKYLGSVTGLDYPHAVNAWSYTARRGFVMNFDEMVGGILPLFVNPITVTAGIGTIPAVVSGMISKLEGGADMCSIERGLVGGALTNLASFITNPWAYGVSNTWGSYTTNVAVNNCR